MKISQHFIRSHCRFIFVSYKFSVSVGLNGSFGVRHYCAKEKKKEEPGQSSPKKKEKKNEEPTESSPKKDSRYAVKLFKVYRFAGTEANAKPYVETFSVDTSNISNMLLDALLKMKDMDPTLTFRRSCREGICGSCAMNIQGENVLACIKNIPDVKTINIYPLPHMYVIRDLVVDLDFFYEGYSSIRPYIIRNQEIPLGTNQYAQSIKDNELLVGLYECVLCACCSTACPSYWWNGRRFLGPATLMHAYRWVIDTRDDDTTRRLRELRDDFKAYRCHSIFQCSVTCPRGLHPGGYIQKLKRLIAGVETRKLPDIDPMEFARKRSKERPTAKQCGCK